MTKREIQLLVVGKTISTAVCLAILYGTAKLIFWIWPSSKWINMTFLSLLAIDFALIVSGIKPEGIFSWYWKGKKKDNE